MTGRLGHRRHRPRRDVRRRRRVHRRGAAVLPRLPGGRPGRARTGRRRSSKGVAEGCRRAGCALLGGETAEHPGMMPDDQFDLAGFCVGLVRRGRSARAASRAGGRRADRARVERAARQRLLAGAQGAARPLRPRRDARRARAAARRRAPGAVRDRRARGPGARARRAAPRRRPHHRRRLPRERPARAARRAWGARSTAARGPSRRSSRSCRAASGATDDDMFSTFNMGIGMVLVVDPPACRRGAGAATTRGRSRSARVVPGAGVRDRLRRPSGPSAG